MAKFFISEQGTAFDPRTPKEVREILDRAINARQRGEEIRLRLWYGDTETGRDWGDVYDVYGYVGRSCGTYKIPLLIKRRDSSGGSAILDHCIIRITVDKQDVYHHPKFHNEGYRIEEASDGLKQSGYNWSVFCGESNVFNCKTRKQAENEVAFHEGRRNVA